MMVGVLVTFNVGCPNNVSVSASHESIFLMTKINFGFVIPVYVSASPSTQM